MSQVLAAYQNFNQSLRSMGLSLSYNPARRNDNCVWVTIGRLLNITAEQAIEGAGVDPTAPSHLLYENDLGILLSRSNAVFKFHRGSEPDEEMECGVLYRNGMRSGLGHCVVRRMGADGGWEFVDFQGGGIVDVTDEVNDPSTEIVGTFTLKVGGGINHSEASRAHDRDLDHYDIMARRGDYRSRSPIRGYRVPSPVGRYEVHTPDEATPEYMEYRMDNEVAEDEDDEELDDDGDLHLTDAPDVFLAPEAEEDEDGDLNLTDAPDVYYATGGGEGSGVEYYEGNAGGYWEQEEKEEEEEEAYPESVEYYEEEEEEL
ncbi:hypothetical protein FB451DRAFT_681147 [Mycena latifolia]|nr:hypothetical protein FB451DRAFT_681147 [Mycena latifolia]